MNDYKCDQCGQPAKLFCLPEGSADIRYACNHQHAVRHPGGEWKKLTLFLHGPALANAATKKATGLGKKQG